MASLQQTQRAEFTRTIIMWLALALAIFSALMYVLIAFGILGLGQKGLASDGMVAWILGIIGYFTGGLLILTRSRKLWITGAAINALMLFAFVRNWSSAPDVLFSPGGLATKIPQILLEIAMLYLIFTDHRTPHPQALNS